MNPTNFPQNKKRKQDEATERNEKWNNLSIKEKLNSLKLRGAENTKQYKKLQELQKQEQQEQQNKTQHK